MKSGPIGSRKDGEGPYDNGTNRVFRNVGT